MTAASTILTEKANHVLTVTLNRPERLNAIGTTMRRELLAALEEAAGDHDVRVVAITGAGRAFSAGGDVKEMHDRREDTGGGSATPAEIPPVRDRILALIRSMPKPVLAVVNGPAVGAGMNLALGCDLRIASERAMFGQVFVKRGLHPDWGGTFLLPRLVGPAKACELIFGGDMIAAQEALALGLVNRLVPHDELAGAAANWAETLAAGPPVAIGLAKRAIYRNQEADLASALEYEAYAQGVVWGTEDAGEGIRAFLEKRPANFQGK